VDAKIKTLITTRGSSFHIRAIQTEDFTGQEIKIVMDDFTTNEEDQTEAVKLQERLRQVTRGDDADDVDGDKIHALSNDSSSLRIANVSIDEGRHKYVLISAVTSSAKERQHFVVSKRGAAYHRNAAEPFVEALERCGYRSIDIMGGGRIALDSTKKTIHVYGYSYGFGLADHALSKSVLLQDPRFRDYDVTWSNEGY
jgi:phosphohistidine phosphatase